MFKKIVMSLSLATIISLSTLGSSSSVLAADDHGDTYDTATKIRVNTSTSGNLEQRNAGNAGKDRDWFEFTAPSTGDYIIKTTGNVDTYGMLYELWNGGTSYVERNDDGPTDSNFEIKKRLQGGVTYYVEVYGYNENDVGNYNLKLELATAPIVTDDHGDTYDTATEITVDSSTLGNIEQRYAGNDGKDRDWFKFTASSTGDYRIRTTGNVDTYGWLYEEWNGKPSYLERDDDSGLEGNFEINKRLYRGETYYVEVYGYNENDTGNYRLRIE